MAKPRKVYWDSSCFICFLNESEAPRGDICDDILRHAQAGDIEIWISVLVTVEVVRPRRPGKAPLPPWAERLITKTAATEPTARQNLEQLWMRTQPEAVQKLTATQIDLIRKMFEWPFIKKANVDDITGRKALDLCRDFGLRPIDAIHAATALIWKCEAIQRWGRDYDKVKSLIASEEPTRISPQSLLIRSYGPSLEDIHAKENESVAVSPDVRPGDNGPVEDKAGAEGKEKTKQEPDATS